MIPPLAAETLFHLGPLPVTNAMINAWVALAFFVGFAAAIKAKVRMIPKGLQNVAEWIMELMLSYCDQVTHDRKKSERFFPLVGTLFLFIVVSNWMGILPGIGSIGMWLQMHGHIELVPIFRPVNSDLNMTLAMGITAVAASHVFGIIGIGFFKHIGKFIQLGKVFKSIAKGPMAILTAIIEFFVGLLEIISEIAKMVSLSLRLFGNIFAGEVLLTVMAGLIAWLVPTPFMALELIVGIIQATVFAMLALVYLEVATSEPH
jgi:F-type H+-transporting ATPase subunit a